MARNSEAVLEAEAALLKSIKEAAEGTGSASTLRNLAEAYALVTGLLKSTSHVDVKTS